MSETTNISPLKRFFSLINVDRQEIISIYIYAMFNGILSLTLPLGIQAIINLISGGQVSTSWIILVLFVIAGVGLTGIMQIMQLSISENLQQKIFTRSAFEFAYRIPRLKLESVDKYHIPELVNRFFDTLSVQKGLSKILMDFSSASLQIVFGLILLSLYHPFFIIFSMLLIVVAYFIFRLTAPYGLKTSLAESKRKYEVAHWLEELGRTMETFKLAGKSPLPMDKTDEVVQDYLGSRKAHFKSLLIQYINLIGFKVVIAAGLLVIGGLLVINQQMNIGQFVASEIIIILVLSSVEKLILSMETIYDVLTAIEKIGTVTDIPLERDTGSKSSSLEKSEGVTIHLNNVSYRFKDSSNNALTNINLKLASGEKVCLSGFGGAGKSLLLQIVAGLYQDFTGSVLYNSIPLGNWCIEDLRSAIGDSLSREDIFRGTLFENIALNKPNVTIEDVHKSASVLGLDSYVESLPEGYNTMMMPEGKSLPKSIRLKIMLARCISGKPQLLLLGDNFNQLNYSDKQRLLDHIITEKCTVIAVSNNPAVASRFNKVAVLDEGKLIACDTFNEIQNKEWYNSLYISQ